MGKMESERGKLLEILGVKPFSDEPLSVSEETREEDGLIIEKVSFRSLGDVVPGYVVRPGATRGTKFPAVICMHGTGEPKEQLIERSFGAKGSASEGWARELARRGFLTLSIDIRGGEGRKGLDIWSGALVSLLKGQPYMGLLVNDVMRCVDYLAGRQDVQEDQIAVTGFSLGGCISWYAAAADPRIALCAPICGGVGRYKDLIEIGTPSYHSTYFWPPGFLQVFPQDQPEVLSLICPRRLLVLAKDRDIGMPLSGIQAMEKELKEVYHRYGVSDNFRVYVSPGEHEFTLDLFEELAKGLEEAFVGNHDRI